MGIAKTLFDIEKRLRELATDIQLRRITWMGAIEALEEAYDEMFRALHEMVYGERKPYVDENVENLLEAAKEVVERVHSELVWQGRVPERDLTKEKVENLELDGYTDNLIDEMDKVAVELFGKPCAFKASRSLASRLNDAAACIHRLAEYLAKFERARKVGKCSVVEGASSDAERLCRTWSEYVEKLDKMYFYLQEDFEALEGWVVDGRVYLRVGSAEGHRTEVDLKGGRLRYYDRDDDVNDIMARLLEWAGAECRVLGDGVECDISKADMDKVAYSLALATSMDVRFRRSLFPMKLRDALFKVDMAGVPLLEVLKEVIG